MESGKSPFFLGHRQFRCLPSEEMPAEPVYSERPIFMKRPARKNDRLLFGILLLLLLLTQTPLVAVEPTLARLSFWVPPERVEEFAAVYAEQVVPLRVRSGDRGFRLQSSFLLSFAVLLSSQ